MVTLRLRYENGHLIPLDPLPDLEEGEEIEVQWQKPSAARQEELRAMLDRSRGIWADHPEIEEYIKDAREKWDQEWRDRFSSL